MFSEENMKGRKYGKRDKEKLEVSLSLPRNVRKINVQLFSDSDLLTECYNFTE